MTKREIIYSVFEKLNLYTDDSDISEEFVSSLIDSKRAMLMKQRFAKNPWHMPLEVKQEVCESLEVTDNVDGIACFGKILRTKNPLPRSIKIKGKEGPLNIRFLDRRQIPVNIVPIERMPYLGYNNFIGSMIFAAADHDGRLYFYSKRKDHLFLEEVKISDIYENPEEAMVRECRTVDDSVELWDREYPVENAMVDDIVNLIAQELGRTIQMPQDDENDAEDTRG